MPSSIAEELDCFVEKDSLQYSSSVKARTVVYASRRPDKDVRFFCLPKRYSGRYSSQVGVLCGLEN